MPSLSVYYADVQTGKMNSNPKVKKCDLDLKSQINNKHLIHNIWKIRNSKGAKLI